jgi:predicted dehydrogenase
MPERANRLAAELGCLAGRDWQKLVERDDIDTVVVATTHKYLAQVTVAALESGKHVFCEKPMGRNVEEAEAVVSVVRGQTRTFHPTGEPRILVGYTLRHHPAVRRAWQIVKAGNIGRPFLIRGRYGHGGRAGYDKEWRTDPEESGGGELLDQGVHLVDLSRCFLGHFCEVMGLTACFHWARESSSVEDNAFLLMRTPTGCIASLHASWTQWKNLFSFEVFGEEGAVLVEGLGGSYGLEKLAFVRRLKAGVPDVEEILFPPDRSDGLDEVWATEWRSFVDHIGSVNPLSAGDALPPATPEDAREVLAITERVSKRPPVQEALASQA